RAVQHLRRHNPLRRGGQGPDRGLQPGRGEGALRGPSGRHERRGGPPAPGRGQPAQRDGGEDDVGRRPEGGRTGQRRERKRSGTVSILVDESTKLAVSGLTGREGSFHALNNRRYGTDVVA